MEYLIYCDESVSVGEFYSNFYGGVLVKNKDFDKVNKALEDKKAGLNLFGEIKWTKVTAPYLDKYKQMMDLFFQFVGQHKLKMRVMFHGRARWRVPYRHWKFIPAEFRKKGI